MRSNRPFSFFVAGVLQVPWDQANARHSFRLDLFDADRQPIPTQDGADTVHVEGQFEAGRPAGLTPGTPLDVPFVVPFGPLALQPGRYEIRLSIDGETRDDWYLAFSCQSAPAA